MRTDTDLPFRGTGSLGIKSEYSMFTISKSLILIFKEPKINQAQSRLYGRWYALKSTALVSWSGYFNGAYSMYNVYR